MLTQHKKLQDDTREAIKKRLGELISIVPGKSGERAYD